MNRVLAATTYLRETSQSLWARLPPAAQVACKVTATCGSYFLPGGILLAPALAYKAFDDQPIILSSWRVPFTGSGPTLPADPKKPLADLAHRIYGFKVRQPEQALWREPVVEPQPAAGAPAVSPADVVLDLDQEPTPGLGANPLEQQVNWEEKTQANRNKLVENSANYTTLFFLHVNRLGLQVDDEVLMSMAREASSPDENGEPRSLWSVYMKHLGHNLGFFQKVYTGFWYLLSHSTGLIRNSIDTFLKNVITEFQQQLVSKDREARMESLFSGVLGQMSSFLDIYNGAIREYAETSAPNGDAKDYRKRAIQTLTGKTLTELCAEFSNTLVDQFFPRVPFFDALRESRWFGWLYAPIDFLIGTPLNWVGRKIVKYLMPDAVQKIVETGVQATDPTNLPFSIAITNTLTELFLNLSGQPVENIPVQEIPGTASLPTVVDKLLITLDLTGTDDTQPALRRELARIDGKTWIGFQGERDRLIGTRQEIQSGVVRAIQTLCKHLVEDKEATQKLLSDLLYLFNIAFDQSSPLGRADRLNEYIQAKEGLENAAARFFEKVVRAGVTEKVRGQGNVEEIIAEAHGQQKNMAISCFAELEAVGREMGDLLAQEHPSSLLLKLDHAIELLRKFSSQVQQLKIEAMPKAAREGFYRSFYPIYQQAEALGAALVRMQDLQVTYTNNVQLEAQFSLALARLNLIAGQMNHSPDLALRTLGQIEEQAPKLPPHLPQDAVENTLFRQLNSKLSVWLHRVKTEEDALKALHKMQKLLAERCNALRPARAPEFNLKQSSALIRETLKQLSPQEAAQLTPLLQELQAFDRTAGISIDSLADRLTSLLIELGDARQAQKEAHMQRTDLVLGEFRGWARRQQDSHRELVYTHLDLLRQTHDAWMRQIDTIQADVHDAKPEKQHHPLQYVPEGAINWAADKLGLQQVIMDKFRAAYKLITSPDIYDASARLIMNGVIESY